MLRNLKERRKIRYKYYRVIDDSRRESCEQHYYYPFSNYHHYMLDVRCVHSRTLRFARRLAQARLFYSEFPERIVHCKRKREGEINKCPGMDVARRQSVRIF